MTNLQAFFQDKEARKEWAAFINEQLDAEALTRVYAGKDTAALKEAREIIAKSFKKLDELFTHKKAKPPVERGV